VKKKGIDRIRDQCFRRAMNARQMAPMMSAGSAGDSSVGEGVSARVVGILTVFSAVVRMAVGAVVGRGVACVVVRMDVGIVVAAAYSVASTSVVSSSSTFTVFAQSW